jgi:hypothetical protein
MGMGETDYYAAYVEENCFWGNHFGCVILSGSLIVPSVSSVHVHGEVPCAARRNGWGSGFPSRAEAQSSLSIEAVADTDRLWMMHDRWVSSQ